MEDAILVASPRYINRFCILHVSSRNTQNGNYTNAQTRTAHKNITTLADKRQMSINICMESALRVLAILTGELLQLLANIPLFETKIKRSFSNLPTITGNMKFGLQHEKFVMLATNYKSNF